jgi:hypothetical protein
VGGWIAIWAPSEWRRRWPALIALAVLVAIAGGVATGLGASARRADSSFERFLVATGAANLSAHVALGEDQPGPGDDAGDGFSVDRDAVAELAAVPGVESVLVDAWWAIALWPDADPPGVVTAFALGISGSAGEPRTPLILDGEYPAPDDRNAVVVNEEAVRMFRAPVGTMLRFKTASSARLAEWAANDGQFGSHAALDGPAIDVEVVAVTRTQEDLGADRFPSIFFPEGFAAAHAGTIAHVEPSVSIRIDPSRLAEARPGIVRIAERYGLDVVPAPSTAHTVDPTIGVEVTTLQLAALVAALAGALVLATVLTRQAAAISPRPAVGGALGLTRSQRAVGTWLVLTPALVAGAAAVPIVAWVMSAFFPRGLARLADPDPGRSFDIFTILVGTTVTLLAALLVAATSALAATSRVRASQPTRARTGGVVLGSPPRLLGASFAVDPTGTGRRSRVLAGATVAALAIGVAAVVTVSTLEASRIHLAASPRLFGAAAPLVYESNGTFGIADVVDAAMATSGVDALTRQLAVDEDTVTVEAQASGVRVEIEPEAYETRRGGAIPPVVEGRFPQGPDEVALGEATAESLGAAVGDTVHVEPIADGPELSLRVTGMVVAWDSVDPLHAFVVTPDTLHLALCADVPFEECNVSTRIFADVATDEARTTLLGQGFVAVPAPANVDRLEQVGSIPWYLAAFLCVLAAAAVLSALLTALRRRRRDIAIARALGLTGSRAADSLVWQAVLTAVAGVTIGVVFGVILGPVIWRIIADDVGVIARPVVPVVAVGLVAVGGLMVAAALSLGPRLRAARLPMTVALRSE